MSPDERRRLLGAAVIAHIQSEVEAAPPPPPDVLDNLRRIFTGAAGRRTERPRRRPAA
jgi:hypothetical protein